MTENDVKCYECRCSKHISDYTLIMLYIVVDIIQFKNKSFNIVATV